MTDTAQHEHSFPCGPPRNWFNPGDCECGALYADAEQRWAEELAAVEWAVFVSGMGLLTHENVALPDDDPDNAAFTEQSARAYADWVNTAMPPIFREGPQPTAAILHHGVPVTDEAS
jgi:hypothetical protein